MVPPTHNREPYDTLLYCPTSCPYRSVCGTDAACSSNTIRDSISRVAPSLRAPPGVRRTAFDWSRDHGTGARGSYSIARVGGGDNQRKLSFVWWHRARGVRGGSASTMQRRTLLAVALVLLPIALADDTVVAAATFGIAGFAEAFTASMGVIFGTELGDKTFFIAAIMSMRHPRFTVWFGAVGALAAMTVLSTIVGHVAPMLLPPSVRRSSDSMRPLPPPPPDLPRRVSRLSPLLSLAAHPPSVSPPPPHRPLPPRPLHLPKPDDAIRWTSSLVENVAHCFRRVPLWLLG